MPFLIIDLRLPIVLCEPWCQSPCTTDCRIDPWGSYCWRLQKSLLSVHTFVCHHLLIDLVAADFVVWDQGDLVVETARMVAEPMGCVVKETSSDTHFDNRECSTGCIKAWIDLTGSCFCHDIRLYLVLCFGWSIADSFVAVAYDPGAYP